MHKTSVGAAVDQARPRQQTWCNACNGQGCQGCTCAAQHFVKVRYLGTPFFPPQAWENVKSKVPGTLPGHAASWPTDSFFAGHC